MTIIIDASIAFKCLVEEPDSRSALLLLQQQDCLTPDFLLVEVRNAILTRVRSKRLSPSTALALQQDLSELTISIVPTTRILPRAFAIALELGHPIYDCLYLAAAVTLDLQLVTGDQRFLSAVRRSKYVERGVSLAEFGTA